MREVDQENAYWRVLLEPDVARVERSTLPYPSVGECERALQALEHALRVATADALLIDSRRARGTQDPEIERAIMQFSQRMSQRFARVAALVASSVGMLQSQRLVRTQPASNVRVFNDERAALAYLTEGDARLS